jgi:hypothetical protein
MASRGETASRGLELLSLVMEARTAVPDNDTAAASSSSTSVDATSAPTPPGGATEFIDDERKFLDDDVSDDETKGELPVAKEQSSDYARLDDRIAEKHKERAAGSDSLDTPALCAELRADRVAVNAALDNACRELDEYMKKRTGWDTELGLHTGHLGEILEGRRPHGYPADPEERPAHFGKRLNAHVEALSGFEAQLKEACRLLTLASRTCRAAAEHGALAADRLTMATVPAKTEATAPAKTGASGSAPVRKGWGPPSASGGTFADCR